MFKGILLALALLTGGSAMAAEPAYEGSLTNTTTGRATHRLNGYMFIGKSSTTASAPQSTPTITLDGTTGGINASSGTFAYSVQAPTATFTGNGATTYSVTTSSGINVQGGMVVAPGGVLATLYGNATGSAGSIASGGVGFSTITTAINLVSANTGYLRVDADKVAVSTTDQAATNTAVALATTTIDADLTSEVSARQTLALAVAVSTTAEALARSNQDTLLLGYINSTGSALTSEISRAIAAEATKLSNTEAVPGALLDLSTYPFGGGETSYFANAKTFGSSITVQGAGGILATSSVTASAFFGDGSHMTGITGGIGAGVLTATQTWSGADSFLSSVTVGPTIYTTTATTGAGAETAIGSVLVNSWMIVASTSPSGSTSVTFTGLQPGKEYWIVANWTQNTSGGSIDVSYNHDSGGNYQYCVTGVRADSTSTGLNCSTGGTFCSSSAIVAPGVSQGGKLDYRFATEPSDSTRVLSSSTRTAYSGTVFEGGNAGNCRYDGASNLSSVTLTNNAGTTTGKIYLLQLITPN